MTEGRPIAFADCGAPSQSPAGDEYTVPMLYENHPDKEAYGPVGKRFEDAIELELPIADIEELRRKTHLIAQLHHFNRRRWDDWSYPNDARTLYDVAILDKMVECLKQVEFPLDDLAVPEGRLKFVFLKRARRPDDLKSFYTYLENNQETCDKLGFFGDELPSYESLRLEANNKFPSTLDRLECEQAFEDAVTVAIYAVYRNGIEAPDSVKTAYGFDRLSPPLYEKAVPRTNEQTALRNWVNFLIEETLDPLTFGRESPRIDFTQYLGLFAASALYGCGVQEVANLSDYQLPRAVIPKGSGVGKYIRDEDLKLDAQQAAKVDASLPSITEQFDAVHRATLDIARRRGFFTEPRSLAADIYRIESTNDESSATINRPGKSENDVRAEWTYAMLGIIDTDARFVVGTRYLREKSAYPEVLADLGAISTDFVDVEALYADSELISGNLIESLYGIAGCDWVVRAPNHDIVKKLKHFTPEQNIGYAPNVSWNTALETNLVAYPYNGSDPSVVEFTPQDLLGAEQLDPKTRQTLFEFETDNDPTTELPDAILDALADFGSMNDIGDITDHATYLTGRKLSDSAAYTIHFPYYQRWAIEQSINQVSNQTMPVINSSDPHHRLYGVNLAVLFENWHTLINRSPSPETGLRLDVTQKELLRAIEDVAFRDDT